MKLLLCLLLVVSVSVQWEPDFESAKKIAREKNERILLNFSGSDWCGPCIAFRKDYLESEAFGQYAKDHLVLVNADFPRKSKNQLSPEMTKRNAALADVYNKQGNFPFTLVLDADGKVLKTWSGKPTQPLEEWIAELRKLEPSK